MNITNQGPLLQGYARLDASPESFALYAVLTSAEPSGFRPPFRTFVPGVRRLGDQQRLFFNNIPFDVSCVAIVSQVSLGSEEPIRIIARDENGAEIQRTEFENLDQGQHTAFCLPDALQLTAGTLGVLDIIGTSAVIGFTFDSDGKMHTEMPYSVFGYDVDPDVAPPPPTDPDPPPADPDPPPTGPDYDY